MSIYFLWETLLSIAFYYIFKPKIKQGLTLKPEPHLSGIGFLLKSRNPILKLFRISVIIALLTFPVGVWLLLIPNEIFIYGFLIGVLIFTFLLLPPKGASLPFAKELPFIMALFGFTPMIMGILFLLNATIPVAHFSKTYPIEEFKTYHNPDNNYWIKPEDELYKTTKVLLKIPQTNLTPQKITIFYEYGISGLVRIKDINYQE